MNHDLYWIEGPWAGRLAIVLRPRGGDWLEDEVLSWKRAGLNVIVSLLTETEVAEFDLAEEGPLLQTQGLQFQSFPIVDRSVPASMSTTLELTKHLDSSLSAGSNVGVHCRQSVGRSALIAACLLVFRGMNPEDTFALVSAARGCQVPETDEQREWISRFAPEHG